MMFARGTRKKHEFSKRTVSKSKKRTCEVHLRKANEMSFQRKTKMST